jgi:hypothetical protein
VGTQHMTVNDGECNDDVDEDEDVEDDVDEIRL